MLYAGGAGDVCEYVEDVVREGVGFYVRLSRVVFLFGLLFFWGFRSGFFLGGPLLFGVSLALWIKLM